MTSNIDPTKPGTGVAFTADVRSNFQSAHDEIGVLQANTLPLHGVNLPQSTGTPADLAAKGIISGDLYLNGGVVCVAP